MNPIICPSILAADDKTYRQQVERVAPFAQRMQIDLTDGQFAPHPTISVHDAWWPVGTQADIHLMFAEPKAAIEFLVEHKPNLIIVHAEASLSFKAVKKLCRNHDVRIGVALLPETEVSEIEMMLDDIDHVLVFSGDLGSFGGHANLNLLDKVSQIKQYRPELEVGWDGGVNDQNVAMLVAGGVDVLNVGGFIQHSTNPAQTFEALQRIADETGTT